MAEPADDSPADGSLPATDTASAATFVETTATLREIEARPLGERAPGYHDLADRLRAELEHSDPARSSG